MSNTDSKKKILFALGVVFGGILPLAMIVAGCSRACPPWATKGFPLAPRWNLQAGSSIVGTPGVTGGRLVVPTTRGIFGVDIATGALLWSTSVPPVVPPAPLLVGEGKVVVGQREGVIVLDEETGGVLWTAPNTGCNSTSLDVVPAAIHENTLYVIREGCSISAYDLQGGAMRWQVVVSGGRWVATLFVDGGELFLAVTGEALQIRNAETGALLEEADVRIGGGAAYRAGILYTFDTEDHLVAFDVRARQVLWTGPSVYVVFSYPPLVTGRYILTPIHDGYPAAYDVATGNLLWTADSATLGTYQTPVVVGEVVYIREVSTGTVYALSLHDGSVLGCLFTEGALIGVEKASDKMPVAANGLLIIPSGQGIYAYGP